MHGVPHLQRPILYSTNLQAWRVCQILVLSLRHGLTFVAFSLRWKSLLLLFAGTVLLIIVVGCRVSQRLLATESVHPKPAEAPSEPAKPAAE